MYTMKEYCMCFILTCAFVVQRITANSITHASGDPLASHTEDGIIRATAPMTNIMEKIVSVRILYISTYVHACMPIELYS